MLYFAYGSNMDWAQMKERCPSVRFVGNDVLNGYRFDFTRRSNNRDCGGMDIVKEDHGQIWGVIYQIDELEIGNLDKSEGYLAGRLENAYQRIERTVLWMAMNPIPSS